MALEQKKMKHCSFNTQITLSGVFSIRVAALNLAGLGAASELEIVGNG